MDVLDKWCYLGGRQMSPPSYFWEVNSPFGAITAPTTQLVSSSFSSSVDWPNKGPGPPGWVHGPKLTSVIYCWDFKNYSCGMDHLCGRAGS